MSFLEGIWFAFGTIFICIVVIILFHSFSRAFGDLRSIRKKREAKNTNKWEYHYNSKFLGLLHRKDFINKRDYEALLSDLKKRLL